MAEKDVNNRKMGKITKKIRKIVLDTESINRIYPCDGNETSGAKYFFVFNNTSYYFNMPSVSYGEKLTFNTSTNKLYWDKLDSTSVEISTSSTGTSSNELTFAYPPKWSDDYIDIGANASNVICSDGHSVQYKLNNLSGDYVEKTGDTMTGALTTPILTVGSRSSGTVGEKSFAQGHHNLASGEKSFAQGFNNIASGEDSHAEGTGTSASGDSAHSEGSYTHALEDSAHAEGTSTYATAIYSHAEGSSTQARTRSQHVQGEYNIYDTTGSTTTRGTYAHIVGNGTSSTRSNAHTLDWSGNAWFAGDVYVKSTSGTNKDEGSKKLATEDLLTAKENITNKVTTLSAQSTDTQYPSAKAVYDQINAKIATAYKPMGSCTFENLPSLVAANEGYVYNITNNFTTTIDFIEGAGKNYIAGTDVAIINNGTAANPIYKYDVLGGAVDLTNYVEKTGDIMTGTLTMTGLTVGSRSDGTFGTRSVAEGANNIASGANSHAEGYENIASGNNSHVEGKGNHTIAYSAGRNEGQHVQGLYNISSVSSRVTNLHVYAQQLLQRYIQGDTSVTVADVQRAARAAENSDYLHIVGNGADDESQSNAHILDHGGNAWFSGDVYTGSTSGTDWDDGAKKLATEEYVQLNGGKIDSISANGVAQTIDENKNVDLTIPIITYGQTELTPGTSLLNEGTFYFVYE